MSTAADTHTEPGHAEAEAHPEHAHPSDAKYVQIALILAAITAAEVASYYLDLSSTALLLALIPMMVVKFAMVALWFMHLKFDSHIFRGFFVTGIILAVAVYLIVMSAFQLFD